ncbi:neuronal-specific septin-3 isoform X2 [Notamacropus eugenii]|uniref:neuronal-specific septin-3 isoform X2 n=1 Tax=Notamacropus eugenii TaxID=9315 RepID=UPI003B67692D
MDRNRTSPPGNQQPGEAPLHLSRPSGIPVASPPLSPGSRKTLSLGTITSHLPLPLSQAGARARSSEPGTARRAMLRPTSSPVPRKLSSLSFTLHHHSHREATSGSGSSPQHEAAVRDRKGSAQEKGESLIPGAPPASLEPIIRVHSASPGNPNPIGPTGAPVLEKPLLTSHLTLPLQPCSAQSPSTPAGIGLPFRYTSRTLSLGSPGRVGTQHLGIPRLRLPSGRVIPASGLFKSGKITLARSGRVDDPVVTPGTLGTIMDPAPPGIAAGSARSDVGPGPTESESAMGPAPSTIAEAEEDRTLSRKTVTFFQVTDLEKQGGVGHQPRPGPAPNPATDLSLHTLPACAARVVATSGPGKGSPASTLTAMVLPLPSHATVPATAKPGSVLSTPGPLPGPAQAHPANTIVMLDKSIGPLAAAADRGAPCTTMILATSHTARNLASKDAKVVFTVPGIDISSALPRATMGLPMPRRAQPCTAMVLVTPQKATSHRTMVAHLTDSGTVPATPGAAFKPPMPAIVPIMTDVGSILGMPDHTSESDTPESEEEEATTAPQALPTERAADLDDLDALDLAVAHKGFHPLRPNWMVKMEGLSWKFRRGFADNRTDVTMSELVAEPKPKPAVPMKPLGISSNLLGYIGIDTIIEQMRKKTMKTGFDFNIMVVGQSGLGKSTLINTLFKSQVSRKSASWNREEKIPKTVEIKAIGHVIEEGGVKMKLTVIDTPGFGDQINNENCWEPIEKYINEQYEKFLKEEVNIARKKRIPDTRVHCCLYFISPTGHSLRPLDLEFMKHLSKVVNIVPIIAKADTMTLEEKTEFKQRVRKELEVNGIEFYPQKEFDEDLEDKTENDKIRESMPFAVVGSDKEYQVNGKRVLGRKTPWGIIEVENLTHCEFALLRDFVIRTHLQDLKEVTHNIHYETYRARRLNDNGGLPPGEGILPPAPASPCPATTAD